MNILIDGYNLLKQIFTGKEIAQAERDRFIKKLQEYAHRKGHSIFIVFDGGSHPRPTKEKNGPVSVIYSGYKDSADDVIKHYLDEKILKNLLVVTTDRQLNSYADQYGIPSLDSVDFYQILSQKEPQVQGYKKSSGQAQKLRSDEPLTQLDILMQEGSQMLQHKNEEPSQVEHPLKTSSKIEKRMLAILKKL